MKKNFVRILAGLLALILILSILPLAGFASELSGYKDATHFQNKGGVGFTSVYNFNNGIVVVADGKVIQSNVSGYSVGDSISKVSGPAGTWIASHVHSFEWTVARDGHYFKCTCGTKHNYEEHIDPKDAVDGKCICGYEYMDNADMTVLWMKGIQLSPSFKKEVTEYTGKLLYEGLEETEASIFTFDAKASVEMPKDLTLKKGTNTFEFKVTAEDGVTTKTYTVTVEVE